MSKLSIITGYHTTENRGSVLPSPLLCCDSKAWLGCGYYFWEDVRFAKDWGEYKKYGKNFDIYSAELDIRKCIDAEFSREGRKFFEYAINTVKKEFENAGSKIPLEKLHKYLSGKFWSPLDVTGIIYGDTPRGAEYRIEALVYIKRVQIVMFDFATINNFRITD